MTLENIALILIAGAGLVHGLWTALYIGLASKKTLANKLLTWLLLLFAFRIGKSVALHFLDDLEFLFVFTGLAAMLVIGPMLYFYFRASCQKAFKWEFKYLLHFLPAAITMVIAFFINEGWFLPGQQFLMIILVSAFYIHLLIYITLAYQVYACFKKVYTSGSAKKISSWLKVILIGISFIWVAYFLNIYEDAVPYILGPILYSIVIYSLTYYGLKSDILNYNIESLRSFEALKDSAMKFEALQQLIEQEEKYLDPDLSLSLLAKAFKLSTHELSRLINEHAQTNFNDFLNYYRVKKSQELLTSSENAHITISSVALDCGFNSISSFNTAFKKVSGMTPSRYKSSFQATLAY